jgi:hypothetical protein
MYGNTNTLLNHVQYTKNEWSFSEYHKQVINFLSEKILKTHETKIYCMGT